MYIYKFNATFSSSITGKPVQISQKRHNTLIQNRLKDCVNCLSIVVLLLLKYLTLHSTFLVQRYKNKQVISCSHKIGKKERKKTMKERFCGGEGGGGPVPVSFHSCEEKCRGRILSYRLQQCHSSLTYTHTPEHFNKDTHLDVQHTPHTACVKCAFGLYFQMGQRTR